MRARWFNRARWLLLAPAAVCAVTFLLWARTSDASGEVQGTWLSLTGQEAVQAAPVIPPAELADALNVEYGRYQSLIAPQQLLSELGSAQIVCIGEAHYEARDMQTAFELLRLLAKKRPVALAVERLSHPMQPALDSLPSLPSDDARLALIKSLLQWDDYQKVWGSHLKDRSGYPTNTPSQPVFESMVMWAAQNDIPIIGLDVSWAERQQGLDANTAYRIGLWSGELEKFLAAHRTQNFEIVLVAGISHCTNAPDTITTKLKTDNRFQSVTSVGQRDAMYQYLSSAKVAQLAAIYGLGDLIAQRPQVAVVSAKGVPEFPAPPDYWIAVHAPDSWN